MKQEDYEKKAEEFLKRTNTTFKAEFLKHDYHFADDKEKRDIFKITLTKGERVYSFNFGQSLADSGLRLINTKGERTRHTNFDVPDDLRNNPIVEKKINTSYKGEKRIIKDNKLKKWFEKNHFRLGGLKLELGKTPTPYDVLACLQKYKVGSFQEFCCDFGYDEDSRKAEKTYKLVLEEYKQVCMLWSEEEIRVLHEIS